MRIAFDQLLESEEAGEVQIHKEPEKTTWRFDLKGTLDSIKERLDKVDGGETSGITGQIGSFCVHGKKIKADLYLGRQGSLAENIGPPPEVVPFEVWKRENDHWEEHYSYTPKDNDLWQNLWDDTFWIWLFGKWIRFNTKNQWLPNTTTNTYSTGVTEGASLAMTGSTKMSMSGGASIEMSYGAKQEMTDGSRLDMSGSGELKISGGGKLNLKGGAKVDFSSAANLRENGGGAISGLQGNIRIGDAILDTSCRVYKLREDFNTREGKFSATLDSFLPGDLFFFIAEKLLEGDAYVRYLDSDGYANGALVNQDVSAVLMLVDKVGEGDNIELHFEKISDANLKANIFPTFSDDYNYILEKEIGKTFTIGFRNLGTNKVIEGQTLIYDKEGTIGVIVKKTNTHGGPVYDYIVISAASEFMNIPPFSFIRLKNDYELSDEVNETNQILLESFEMLTGNLPMQNRTLVNDKNGTLGLVTQIETSPWGDVVVTVVTISASASKLSTKMDSISSILDNNEVVSSVSAVNDEDSLRTLMVKTEAIKLSTGEKRFIFSAVPSASPQNSGAMSPDVFVAFQEAQRNIANLFSSLAGLPRTVVQAGIGMTPTQEELTAAFAEAMEDQPRVNDRFVNVDSKTEFIFDTEEIWQSLSGETIGLATETNSGYVQHSDLDGYISYFVAGVGRVNGWEALKAAVATNAANIATKQNALNRTIGSNDDATGTVTDTGGNLSIPIALTVAAPSPSSSQTTATAVDAPRTLRAQLKTLIDNIAYLFTNAVMLAGTQTIAGTKTFSSAPIITTPSTSSNRAVRYDQVAGIAASPPLTPVSVNITSASYGDIPISGYRLLVTVEPTGSAYYQLTARFVYSGIVPVGTRIFMIIVRPGWNTGSNSWNFNLILKDDSSESVIVSRISTGHNVNGQTSFVMVDALRTPQGWMFFN